MVVTHYVLVMRVVGAIVSNAVSGLELGLFSQSRWRPVSWGRPGAAWETGCSEIQSHCCLELAND